MQYITVTSRTGTVVRISLGALESWEPAATTGGSGSGSGGSGGSLVRFAGQTLTARETPDQIDVQVSNLLPRP